MPSFGEVKARMKVVGHAGGAYTSLTFNWTTEQWVVWTSIDHVSQPSADFDNYEDALHEFNRRLIAYH